MKKIILEDIEIENISAEQTLELRHRVLWPDKPVEHCMVDGDATALHVGAYNHGNLICVASIFTKFGSARLRKFATDPDYQGMGIGSKVIEHVITQLIQDDIHEFWCDARETATNFYTKLGMQRSGERFYKSEVAYYKMSMDL